MLFGHGLASMGMGLFPAMFHVEHLLPLFRSTSAPLNRSPRRHLLSAWRVLPFSEVAPLYSESWPSAKASPVTIYLLSTALEEMVPTR